MILDKIFFKRLIGYIIFIPFSPFWWLQKLIKRKNNIWVFGAWHGYSYSDNSKAIFEYVNQNHNEIISVWLTRDPFISNQLLKKGYRCYMTNSITGVVFSLFAKNVIISCGKSDVNRFFINGAKIFHLWHGAPMKQIGLDEKIDSVIRKNKNREIDNYFYWRILPKYIFTLFDEYHVNFLVSTSKEFSKNLQTAFELSPKRILLTGYPRNDVLLMDNQINKYKEKTDYLIMYMPTFRSKKSIDDLLNEYSFSMERIEELLEKINGRLIIKAHFASESKLNDMQGRVIKVANHPLLDVNHILKDVDVLITDYSGCYFDYLLLNKPIIFTPFDYEDYIFNDRQLYFEYDQIISGPKTKNWIDVEKEILKIVNGNDMYKEKRVQMNKRFNEFQDSNSSKRLFKTINSN